MRVDPNNPMQNIQVNENIDAHTTYVRVALGIGFRFL